MRKTPHYLDTSSTSKNISAQLRVPDDLAYTEGHFKETSIVPGVVLIDWALTLANDMFSDLPDLCEIRNVKFKKPLQPGDTSTLQITWDAEKHTLQFSYVNGEVTHATGSCRLEES